MGNFISIIYPHIEAYFEILIKVTLAVLLGGLIGLERESIKRPAGFRTHILVCVGATLVMMISEHMFKIYGGISNSDPARLGAQVISGIGFLGAGTIIKEGATVKGLTTAASLWAVSCIGLAIGSGFYSGAIITSVMVYLVLILFGKFDVPIISKNKRRVAIKLEVMRNEGVVGDVEKVLCDNQVVIRGIKYIDQTDDTSVIKLFLIFDDVKHYDEVLGLITDVYGVKRIVQY